MTKCWNKSSKVFSTLSKVGGGGVLSHFGEKKLHNVNKRKVIKIGQHNTNSII